MHAQAVITSDILERAIESAGEVALFGAESRTLAGPAQPALMLATEKLWEHVREALGACFRGGHAVVDAIARTIQEEVTAIQLAYGTLGARALEGIRARLARFYAATLRESINTLPTTLEIQSREFVVNAVTVNSTITVGGEVSATITSALKFAAGGEVSIEVGYAPAKPLSSS